MSDNLSNILAETESKLATAERRLEQAKVELETETALCKAAIKQSAIKQAELEQAQRELEHLKKNEDRRIDRLCYRGNTVKYIYDKLNNYKKIIDDCCAQFQMDGNTSVVDLIGKQKAELEQAQVDLKQSRTWMEHSGTCRWRTHWNYAGVCDCGLSEWIKEMANNQ